MKHQSWSLASLLLAALLSLAGCGGGSDDNDSFNRNPGGGAQNGTGTGEGTGGNVNADIVPIGCGGITPDVTVTMQSLTFNPAGANIENGDFVRWTNNDTVAHTVTRGAPGSATAGDAFDSGTIAVGQSVCFQFNTVASYAYFCRIHPEMRGTVAVRQSGNDAVTGTTATAPRIRVRATTEPSGH